MMRKIVTFVLLLICLSVTSVAQVGGGMTDKQVVEYVQNGLLQGKSQQQISTELARRGVTKEQAERVKLLYEQQKKNGKNSSSSTRKGAVVPRTGLRKRKTERTAVITSIKILILMILRRKKKFLFINM